METTVSTNGMVAKNVLEINKLRLKKVNQQLINPPLVALLDCWALNAKWAYRPCRNKVIIADKSVEATQMSVEAPEGRGVVPSSHS